MAYTFVSKFISLYHAVSIYCKISANSHLRLEKYGAGLVISGKML